MNLSAGNSARCLRDHLTIMPWLKKQPFFAILKMRKSMLVGGWATPLKNMNVNWDD